ncbi:hypothetical protein Enr10x_58680 [Gimesia panareensis]|uniref:Uncharacterized protein n=1 Tax=Gimesia panareensis TaxID=2527978 RepID=A0A517QFU2_9PLAN|nr:hypothetical protein Enr10x_58680 [Gimesia panareensis]
MRYVGNYSGKKAIHFFQRMPQNRGKSNTDRSRCLMITGAPSRRFPLENDQFFLFFSRMKVRVKEDMRKSASRCLNKRAAGEQRNRENLNFLFVHILYFVYNINSSSSNDSISRA